MDRTGVIHGRFQVLHNGHMEYLLEGKKRCEHLIIGICNPDMTWSKYSAANPHRSAAKSNPLTYFERFQMLQGAFLEQGIKLEEFDIVPFPINFPEMLHNYVPMDVKFYMTIYDSWSLEKKEKLEALGCDIDVMWQRRNEEKITSGTEVRRLIAEKLPWKQLVPEFVYNYIRSNHIDERIEAMFHSCVDK